MSELWSDTAPLEPVVYHFPDIGEMVGNGLIFLGWVIMWCLMILSSPLWIPFAILGYISKKLGFK